jgi:hypothetical protein
MHWRGAGQSDPKATLLEKVQYIGHARQKAGACGDFLDDEVDQVALRCFDVLLGYAKVRKPPCQKFARP